jgi:hypothetical protein
MIGDGRLTPDSGSPEMIAAPIWLFDRRCGLRGLPIRMRARRSLPGQSAILRSI